MESNEITDISKIANLTKLKKLSLYSNSITDITPLYGLADLEELVLQKNKINNLTGMLDSENNLIWKKIKKLDIARNYQINTYTYRDILAVLCKMSENKTIELNYEHITDTSNLPHYDNKGIAYVTYEDFGARCDGKYDDFIAMRNAHNFANEKNCEVRGIEGKTYHIFKLYEDAADIKTSTDWNGATIVIHDEQIDECSGRNKYLFWSKLLTTSEVIENPSWTITKYTKKLTEISDILEKWNKEGYKEYYCVAENKDKKQYIRYGLNEDSGDNQQDIFIIDSEGNIKNELWWDFEKITSFTIYPMPEESFELKNVNIISNALESKTETPYTRAGTGKQIYYWRNFALNKCANVKISNIKHTLSTSGADDLSGSYHGIIYARNCANIEITDCELFARKCAEYYRSSYDLALGNCINLVCKNVNSNDIYNSERWSACDMSYVKDVLFENCHLNKIGSHESASNVTIKDCEVGVRTLTFNGQGTLNIINTKVASNQFISLRDDFGSSWDGDVNIINCTYKYLGESAGELFDFRFCYDDKENKKLHDFGFKCKFPNVYAENLTIDLENAKNKKAIHIIPNFPEKIGNPYYGNSSYWPEKIYINGYKIINNPNNAVLKLSATKLDTDPNKKYSYVINEHYAPKILENETIAPKLKEAKIGIGGGGMLHSPQVSPFDSNTFIVVADMGGIYVTHDAGLSYDRKNLQGTAMFSYFDPTQEGVVYSGGSGLYRSTDNGDNFELIFPRQDDIIKKNNMNENGLHYYYTESKIYPTNKLIKDCIVNPNDSNNIFVISYYGKNGIVFESKDNGETFEKLFDYTKNTSGNILYDYNKLFYKKETNELFMINYDGVFKFNRQTNSLETVYKSEKGIVRATTVYDTETKFIIIENKDNNDYHTTTKVYYTSDFINKTDITENITRGLDYEYENSTFDYKFTFIEARSINDIYLAHASNNGIYRYDFTGVIRYKDGVSEYLYGIPYYLHLNLKTKNWQDGNIRPYGLAIGKDDEAMVFTTLVGVNYSPDSNKENIHARYSTNLGNNHFVTSGINEQTTYGVRIDPFNKNNLLLLNTDLGLIRSEDNGNSWKREVTGINSNWINTIYDAKFDNYKQDVVYSIWSGRHDAPYNAGNETVGRAGGFAISLDGGKTWNSNYSTGLPANSIPVKMDIVYQENSEERIIYVSVWNEGFFVSHDSGKTFESMNEGIDRVKFNDTYSYILAADIEVTDDGRIFGITSKSTYNKQYNGGEKNEQPGEVFEYINGKWEKIEINELHTNPRDIYYHNGTLYISSTATPIWDYKNGSDFNNYGAGVYTYKDGVVTQIFDESISTTGVQIDSRGTIFISDINGNIYRKVIGGEYEYIYKNYHSVSKGIELNGDDELFLSAFGGGVLRLQNLTSLYDHIHTGGTATCTKKAICENCNEEYGELNSNNHSLETTHKLNEKNVTCAEEGYTGDVLYDCCNKVKEKGTNIAKTEHKYNNGIITKEATYEQEGEKTYTCELCSETKIEKMPKLNKKPDNNNDKVDNDKVDNDKTKIEHKDQENNENKPSNSNNQQVDDTQSSGKLPQTGEKSKIVIGISILILIIFAVYGKFKSKIR